MIQRNILTLLSTLTRFTGLAVFLFFAAMILADGPPNPLHLNTQQKLYAFSVIALIGGLALAFFRPLWGGLLTLSAWFLLAMLSMKIPLDSPFLVAALIAAIHIALARHSVPARVSPALYATFAGLLLIAGNEMFGQPPLFANLTNRTSKIAGTWTTPGMQVQIAHDAKVNGHIDGLSITEAKIYPNRTAFGRLIHWRSDYIIRGKLKPSQSFLLILNDTPTGLSGVLEMPGLPGSRRLNLARL